MSDRSSGRKDTSGFSSIYIGQNEVMWRVISLRLRTSCAIAWLRAWNFLFGGALFSRAETARRSGSGSRYLRKGISRQYCIRNRLSHQSPVYRVISFLDRIPLRPPAGSFVLLLTRSILDMTLIHGISRFTMADIAESTPLYLYSWSGCMND